METYAVSSEVQNVMNLLVSSSKVKQALGFLENDHEKRIADQIEIPEIPAPPFQEEVRATDYTRRSEEAAKRIRSILLKSGLIPPMRISVRSMFC